MGGKTHRASTGDLIWPTLLLSDNSSEVVSSAGMAILLRAQRAGTRSSAAAKLLPKDEGPRRGGRGDRAAIVNVGLAGARTVDTPRVVCRMAKEVGRVMAVPDNG